MIARLSPSLLWLSTAAFLALPFAAPAEEARESEPTPLKRILLKGERVVKGGPAALAETPLAETISDQTLEKKQVTALDDLKRVDAGINSSRLDAGLNIRGLSGSQIMTVIDGIPIPYLSNSARQGAFATSNANGGMDTFDFSSLSSLDVVRGADSSRGGSGALGGIVVLNTLEPDDIIPEDRDWGAVVKSTYDSEDRSLSGSAALAKRIGGTSVLFQGGYRKGHERDNQGGNDLYGPARTDADPADFDQHNLLFKLRQELEGGHRIGVTAERFRRDLDTDMKSQQGPGRSYAIGDYRADEKPQRDRVSLDYEYEAPSDDGLLTGAKATLYWQELERASGSHGRTSANVPYGRDNSISNKTLGFVGSATRDFTDHGIGHSVTAGIDLSFSRWRQYSWALCPTPTTCPTLNNQSEVPDVDSTRLGLTLEDKIAFGDGGFSLTPGLRYDSFHYDPATGGGFASNPGSGAFGPLRDRDGSRVSPKLLANYALTPEIDLFAQWSMAYRAPTVDELYSRFYNPRGRYAQLGNPDLKPETANGVEIGASYESNDLTGRIAAFHNRYDNFIQTVTTMDATGFMTFGYENVYQATISGVEVSAVKSFDSGINLHASLAYAYGKNEDTDSRLRSVAPFKAIVGAGYAQETFGTDLSLTAAAGMADDRDSATFDAPGYATVDLTAWWTPEAVKGLRIQAGVYNLFDRQYFDALGLRDLNPVSASNQPRGFYAEPGRSFKISLTQTF